MLHNTPKHFGFCSVRKMRAHSGFLASEIPDTQSMHKSKLHRTHSIFSEISSFDAPLGLYVAKVFWQSRQIKLSFAAIMFGPTGKREECRRTQIIRSNSFVPRKTSYNSKTSCPIFPKLFKQIRIARLHTTCNFQQIA